MKRKLLWPLLLLLLLLPTAATADLIVMDEPTLGMRGNAPIVQIQPLPTPKEAWVVRSSAHLRETLQEWATRAGWALVWALPENEDFRFDAGNTYVRDNFKDAVTDLVNALAPTVRIRVELRPDNMPPLLYVTSQREGK